AHRQVSRRRSPRAGEGDGVGASEPVVANGQARRTRPGGSRREDQVDRAARAGRQLGADGDAGIRDHREVRGVGAGDLRRSWSEPMRTPRADGPKVTDTVHPRPGARMALLHWSFWSPKSAAFAPAIDSVPT